MEPTITKPLKINTHKGGKGGKGGQEAIIYLGQWSPTCLIAVYPHIFDYKKK